MKFCTGKYMPLEIMIPYRRALFPALSSNKQMLLKMLLKQQQMILKILSNGLPLAIMFSVL